MSEHGSQPVGIKPGRLTAEEGTTVAAELRRIAPIQTHANRRAFKKAADLLAEAAQIEKLLERASPLLPREISISPEEAREIAGLPDGQHPRCLFCGQWLDNDNRCSVHG